MPIRSRVGKFQKKWPHHRESGTGHLLCGRVQIGHQFVAFFYVAAPNCLLPRSMYPRFFMPGSFFGMVAVDRLECSEFHPLGEQVWRGCTDEPTYVGARQSESTQAQV